MTLDTHEFIRRFLMHVLPAGFHRIRYYGFFTSQTRARNIARIRELLALPLIPVDAIKAANAKPEEPKAPEHPCPCCGAACASSSPSCRDSSQSTALRRSRGHSTALFTYECQSFTDNVIAGFGPIRACNDRRRPLRRRRAERGECQ